MVVAVGNGLRSPGHFPRRSSFGFHGDLSHGGIMSRDDDDDDSLFLLGCVCVVCPSSSSCRNKISFSGGMKNTDSVRDAKTMTTIFPLRANHRCIESNMVPCRLCFPLSSIMLLLSPRTITGDGREEGCCLIIFSYEIYVFGT